MRSGDLPAITTPLVTIGVPVFNGAEHLAETLTSALAQEYAPLEVIVADDASTDDSDAICRHFAADPRVRYLRNRTNIGAVANFRRVLDQARGTYFTWLAQDDVLSDRQYVRTTVEYLEQHPDVVGCGTSVVLKGHDAVGQTPALASDALHPDRPWEEARQALFCWPPAQNAYVIYGMYRRAELARVRLIAMPYRRHLSAAYWENPVLAQLARSGRIVSLPVYLRTIQASVTTHGERILQGSSAFDHLIFALWIKLLLLGFACQVRGSLPERLRLIHMAFTNLGRGNLRQAADYRVGIAQIERELEQLQQIADERQRLVDTLQTEIALRRALVGGADTVPDASVRSGDRDVTPRDGATSDPAPGNEPPRARLFDFVRPPSAWHVARRHELYRRLSATRQLCEERLTTIQRLHAEAEALLRRMEASSGTPPGHPS